MCNFEPNKSFRAGARLTCLVCALLIVAMMSATAATVYRCDTDSGVVAYQDYACAAGQQQAIVKIRSAVAYAPSPHYAVSKRGHRHHHASRRRRKAIMSYECRGSDGEIFYRHSGCPHSITDPSNPRHRVTVSARRVPRDKACAQIHRAGAIGRRGHEHDQVVSTYEHDLGNDPCD